MVKKKKKIKKRGTGRKKIQLLTNVKKDKGLVQLIEEITHARTHTIALELLVIFHLLFNTPISPSFSYAAFSIHTHSNKSRQCKRNNTLHQTATRLLQTQFVVKIIFTADETR